MRPHAIQSAAYRSAARFVCLPCGRRSGKTEIAKRKIVRRLRYRLPEHEGRTLRYAYLAPTRDQVKKIAWADFKALVPRHWLLGLPSESELCIRTIFGTELHLIGMDKPARFEGPAWHGVVSDESSDMRPDIDKSIRPAVDESNGFWWMIGVPKRQGIGAQKYRAYCEKGLRGDDGWATFSWPSWDILPERTIEAARRDMDLKDFNEQYGAVWESIGGAAFYAFDRAAHVVDRPHDPNRPILVGADFNVDPMAWALCQEHDDGLYVFDELWLTNTNTPRSLDVLWDRYGAIQKAGWQFFGESAARNRNTAASLSDYAHIKNDNRYAAKTKFPRQSPPRKDRASSCNAILRNAAGEVRCRIHSRCLHLIADLEGRGIDASGGPIEGKSGDPIGHISDGWGYLVHANWPATRIKHKSQSQIGVYLGN